jgi:misacylated tRNA(Ala) deacylase
VTNVTHPAFARCLVLPQDKTRRGLPAKVLGAVRIVEIDGIDQNLCCGTHVSNTAQLQVHALKDARP